MKVQVSVITSHEPFIAHLITVKAEDLQEALRKAVKEILGDIPYEQSLIYGYKRIKERGC